MMRILENHVHRRTPDTEQLTLKIHFCSVIVEKFLFSPEKWFVWNWINWTGAWLQSWQMVGRNADRHYVAQPTMSCRDPTSLSLSLFTCRLQCEWLLALGHHFAWGCWGSTRSSSNSVGSLYHWGSEVKYRSCWWQDWGTSSHCSA